MVMTTKPTTKYKYADELLPGDVLSGRTVRSVGEPGPRTNGRSTLQVQFTDGTSAVLNATASYCTTVQS